MKFRSLTKKLLSVLLASALFANLTFSTFTAASDASDGLTPLSEITVEELETAALNVAAMFAPDEEVAVGEIIPMYDANDTLIGFSVSYTGYIVVMYGKDTYHYLSIIDGWNTGKVRIIDYDNTNFVDTYAVRYTID